jgi:hypothetical protein
MLFSTSQPATGTVDFNLIATNVSNINCAESDTNSADNQCFGTVNSTLGKNGTQTLSGSFGLCDVNFISPAGCEAPYATTFTFSGNLSADGKTITSGS